jgi:uncharacterized RDD family membrane protein YckC
MKIRCPACSQILQVAASAAGKVVKCPCGKQLRVPDGATAPPNPPSQPTSSPAVGAAPAVSTGGFDELTDQDVQPVRSASNPYAAEMPAASSDPRQGYAPPSGAGYAGGVGATPYGVRATLGQRILGALVDRFLMFGIGIAFAMVGGIFGAMIDSQDEDIIVIACIAFCVGMFSMSIVNAVLISMSGQSVGKKVVKTRMVDRENGTQSGFVQGFLLRNFVFGLITSIPCIGWTIGLVDLIMLFPEPNQTLHDKLARTVVIQV